MTRRILFVDGDPAELQAIEDLLRDRPDDWELIFRQRGNDALVEMANQPCDVVFADLHTPDLSGAELLQEVRQCYPKTVRFIMARAGDTEFIRRCGADMHQFLAKPCDAFTLKAALNSALSLDTWLTNENIKAQVAKMRTFRSLPSLYLEVLKALQSPNVSADQIGEIVGRDLAMTAKLLQTVNSAFFALRRRITSPTEAVVILGTETVKSLVMSVQTYAELDKLKPIYFSMDKLWRHNMAVATLAKQLTQLVAGDEKMADEAFTAGMFHDIGKLVLASNFADAYNGVQTLAIRQQLPSWEIEREIFGATHAETGAYLIGLWGLPVTILEAIALHHQPGRSVNPAFSPLTAVHVANALVHEREPEKEGPLAQPMDVAYLESLGLGDRIDGWREMLIAPPSEKPAAPKPKPAAPKPAAPKPMAAKSAPPAVATAAPAPSTPVPKEKRPGPKTVGAGKNQRPWLVAGTAGAVLLVTTFLTLRAVFQAAPEAVVARSQPAKKQHPDGHSSTLFKSAKDAGPTPDESPSSPAEEPTRPSPPPAKMKLPKLKLEGIYYRASNPAAVIDGRTVYRGGQVKGARVVAIDQQSVTLDFDGEKIVLRVKREP